MLRPSRVRPFTAASPVGDKTARQMQKGVQRLMDRFYPEDAGGQRPADGTKPLYDWMLQTVAPTATVLNVGAGPTPEPPRRLRGRFARLVGVDPDPTVLDNTDLDEAHVADGAHLPFADATFAAAYADWTLEHVDDPVPFLCEIRRVLEPGGTFWFRTANAFHYVTAASAITPHWFHTLVANRARALPADAHEPWVTHYRMNRRGLLLRLLRDAGFSSTEIRLVEPRPMYMLFHPVAFAAGVAYERVVNSTEHLRSLRHTMIGMARTG